jgi:primary-amine oxidase
MTVDGVDNAVDEVELERVPVGPDNAYGNAFTRRVTRLARESDGTRTADASVGRAWHVVNPGQPVAYALDPQQAPLLAADAGAAVTGRAAFATRHLWVTRYDPAERYAAGDRPTSIREAPGCRPTSPPTATSTARTSSCGTPSG